MRRHIVDDLAPARASRLATRADTLRNMRRAVADHIEGARLEGWPLEAINFADRARKDLGNAEAILRAQIADLLDPIDGAIDLRGGEAV
jgi:hypothetical protein